MQRLSWIGVYETLAVAMLLILTMTENAYLVFAVSLMMLAAGFVMFPEMRRSAMGAVLVGVVAAIVIAMAIFLR